MVGTLQRKGSVERTTDGRRHEHSRTNLKGFEYVTSGHSVPALEPWTPYSIQLRLASYLEALGESPSSSLPTPMTYRIQGSQCFPMTGNQERQRKVVQMRIQSFPNSTG